MIGTVTSVNMEEVQVVSYPDQLTCTGVGSCIALVLYDDKVKVGAIAHIMLPHSRDVKSIQYPGKYADTAIEYMIKKMKRKGAHQTRIKAKLFGGSNMFPNIMTNHADSIGTLNIKSVMKELKDRDIAIIAQDVGGHLGRSILLDSLTGQVTMKTVKDPNYKIF